MLKTYKITGKFYYEYGDGELACGGEVLREVEVQEENKRKALKVALKMLSDWKDNVPHGDDLFDPYITKCERIK